MSTMSTMSTPATTPGSGRTTPGSGRGRGQKRGHGRGGPKRARRQLHGPDEVPEWIRDRAPGEVFVHELKMKPSDKNWEKKKWEEPQRRWYNIDQGMVGTNVSDWNESECQDNLFPIFIT